MKLKIKVTKDVLRESMWCGTPMAKSATISDNCAIALAVRDIFPLAQVTPFNIKTNTGNLHPLIYLPGNAKDFIREFDDLNPDERILLPELEFEIDLPQAVIDAINIDDIVKSETLELI